MATGPFLNVCWMGRFWVNVGGVTGEGKPGQHQRTHGFRFGTRVHVIEKVLFFFFKPEKSMSLNLKPKHTKTNRSFEVVVPNIFYFHPYLRR